jgi:MFS family permease
MNNYGRRPGLLLAYGIGIVGAILIVTGAALESFVVALAGLLLAGGGMTATLQSRYAATDLALPEHRGRSLSTVVWSTTIGSVVGPNLASPMGEIADQVGIPRLAGPYLLTITVFILAAVLLSVMLRPDPLLTARKNEALDSGQPDPGPRLRMSIRDVIGLVRSIPPALLGLAAMAIGQAAMVAVMSMTPVHLKHSEATLQIIGFVISGHIAGMYAASPLVGIAADRFGRRPVILLGCSLLLTSFVIAGTASGHESVQLAIGLAVLGLGWSCTMIAGSTLLTESVPVHTRPNVQGTADLIMGVCGASAGLLSGVVVGFGSYGLLNLLTTLLVVPLIVLAARSASHVMTQGAGVPSGPQNA